jgi:hypothetical protein
VYPLHRSSLLPRCSRRRAALTFESFSATSVACLFRIAFRPVQMTLEMSDTTPTKEAAVMSSEDRRQSAGSHRRGSVVVDKSLASEEGQLSST